MDEYMGSQEIMKNIKGKALGGAKIPHNCSFPVLRKVDGEYKIAFFVQLFNREQLNRDLMQRPSYWCYADIADGANFVQKNCKTEDFCSAPFDRLYKRGESEQTAVKQDVDDLYVRLDKIRTCYLNKGILDAFAYKRYLMDLFKFIPSGQINFYKELSRLV